VFLTLFFRGFVPFLSLTDFVSRDKNLQVADLQRLKSCFEELVTATTSYPSQADIDRMEDYHFQYAEIYNESDRKYYDYYKRSKVQEGMMDEIFGQENHD